MKTGIFYYNILWILLFSFYPNHGFSQDESQLKDRIIYKIVDQTKEEIRLHYKNEHDILLNTLGNLRIHQESNGKILIFGTNGGMFHPDFSPVGLYIENGKLIKGLVHGRGNGNFSLKPNGIFMIMDDNTAKVINTEDYIDGSNIKFATQSGPMLLIDGDFHPAFNQGSNNLHIRNGVGIMPDGSVVLAMSKSLINFYDFALFFKNLGCKNALYLDGGISQTYFPEENWIQTDRKFGVMVSVTDKQ